MRCTLEYTSLAHSKLSSAGAHSWNQSLGRERRGLFGCFGVWPAYACGARTTIRGWWRPRRMSQSVGAQRSLCAPGKLLYNERRTRHRSNYSAAAFVLQCGSIICECGWVMGRLVRAESRPNHKRAPAAFLGCSGGRKKRRCRLVNHGHTLKCSIASTENLENAKLSRVRSKK